MLIHRLSQLPLSHGFWFFSTKAAKKNSKTFYQALELKTDASQKEVKDHYIKLAKIYHPDVYKGSDKARFELIKQAYDTLSVIEKRRTYDTTIGLRKPVEADQQQETQADHKYEDLGKKPKVKLDYSFDKIADGAEDLDQKYGEFFGKKVETPFEEIRIKENHWWTQMTEQERLRKSFETVYNNPKHEVRTMHQASYKQILNEQINQSNRYEEEVKEAQKTFEYKHSPQYLSKTKRKYLINFFLFSIITLPLLISVATRERSVKEENIKITNKLIELEEQDQESKLRDRFRF